MTQRDTFGGTEDLGDSLEDRTLRGFMEGRKWGEVIAFSTDRVGYDWDTFLINSDGTNKEFISDKKVEGWDQSGTRLMLSKLEDGYKKVYLMDVLEKKEDEIFKTHMYPLSIKNIKDNLFFMLSYSKELIGIKRLMNILMLDTDTNHLLEVDSVLLTHHKEVSDDMNTPLISPDGTKVAYLRRKKLSINDLEKELMISEFVDSKGDLKKYTEGKGIVDATELGEWFGNDHIIAKTNPNNNYPIRQFRKIDIYSEEKEDIDLRYGDLKYCEIKRSHNSKLLATSRDYNPYDPKIFIYDNSEDKIRVIKEFVGEFHSLDWSPDNKRVVYKRRVRDSGFGLYVHDLNVPKRIAKFKEYKNISDGVFWQPLPK